MADVLRELWREENGREGKVAPAVTDSLEMARRGRDLGGGGSDWWRVPRGKRKDGVGVLA
jgi:hypothetical protein